MYTTFDHFHNTDKNISILDSITTHILFAKSSFKITCYRADVMSLSTHFCKLLLSQVENVCSAFTENVTFDCLENGTWYISPETGREYADYTVCRNYKNAVRVGDCK